MTFMSMFMIMIFMVITFVLVFVLVFIFNACNEYGDYGLRAGASADILSPHSMACKLSPCIGSLAATM